MHAWNLSTTWPFFYRDIYIETLHVGAVSKLHGGGGGGVLSPSILSFSRAAASPRQDPHTEILAPSPACNGRLRVATRKKKKKKKKVCNLRVESPLCAQITSGRNTPKPVCPKSVLQKQPTNFSFSKVKTRRTATVAQAPSQNSCDFGDTRLTL